MKFYQLKRGDKVKIKEEDTEYVLEFIKMDGMYGKWKLYDKDEKELLNEWETYTLRDKELKKQGDYYVIK